MSPDSSAVAHQSDTLRKSTRASESPVARSIPGASATCVGQKRYTSIDSSVDAHRLVNGSLHPIIHTEHAGSLEYSFDAAPSLTFFEDAQYILGASANYDEHPTNPLSDPSVFASAQVYGVYSYTPLQQPMSIGHSSEDVSTASVSALSQDQVGAPAAPALAVTPQPSGQGPFTCPVGCQATLSREGEYRRHMKKHASGPYPFPCNQPGCSKSFYRPDKLRDHLRQGHKIFQG